MDFPGSVLVNLLVYLLLVCLLCISIMLYTDVRKLLQVRLVLLLLCSVFKVSINGIPVFVPCHKFFMVLRLGGALYNLSHIFHKAQKYSESGLICRLASG